MKDLSGIVSQFKPTVFTTIGEQTQKYDAVNLSQGFPDFEVPSWILDLAAKTFTIGDPTRNQYAPNSGVPSLRQIISKIYQKHYHIEYDPDLSITITSGATQALFNAALALLNPEDEAIVLEPFYDSYVACIELAGATPVPVTLHAPTFSFLREELEKAFSSKTKVVFLNNPHNPSGRVFSQQELNVIAGLVSKYDCYCISDEVYEFLTYDEARHIPFASLPGMKERCVTISSAGKTFGLTGWKVGYACAPRELTNAIRKVLQFNTFGVNHPLQLALAQAYERLDDYLPDFRKSYLDKRNLFLEEFGRTKLVPIIPKGTYFALCPIPELDTTDVEYCLNLIKHSKVAGIPPSAFYLKSDDGKKYIRFCFAKKEKTLLKAAKLLKRHL